MIHDEQQGMDAPHTYTIVNWGEERKTRLVLFQLALRSARSLARLDLLSLYEMRRGNLPCIHNYISWEEGEKTASNNA